MEIVENSLQISTGVPLCGTNPGRPDELCAHSSVPAQGKPSNYSLISSFPAACEIKINREQESTKQTVKRDAGGVFMKHESKH